jgi:formate dehydrogenase major subunit
VNISRRDFLKISTFAAAGTFATTLGLPRAFAQSKPGRSPLFKDRGLKAKIMGKHTPSICPFCSVGCGIGIYTGGLVEGVEMEGVDEVMHIEGDPDNPINGCPDLRRLRGGRRRPPTVDTIGGSVCSKAQHLFYVTQRMKKLNKNRQTKVRYRKPGSSKWTDLDFKKAVSMIVERMKKTRDDTFVDLDDDDNGVNRCEGIGFIGGSATNNEPNYAFSKLVRALGLVYVDNEARDSYAPAIKAMRETFGRPGMTNTIPDIRNARQVLIIGANPGADQPAIMRYVFEAQDHNAAHIIVVDPRVSRTAATASMHVRIRPGTDLALIGGIINYILSSTDKIYHEDYIIRHTDASFVLDSHFLTATESKGVFSGFVEEKRVYDKEKGNWEYLYNPRERKGEYKGAIFPKQDPSFKMPRTVLNVLRKQFSRYTAPTVCQICGIEAAQFEQLCKIYSSTYRSGDAGVILFGRGVMSQVTGAQTVRALAILQLLLGNIGVPGGGLVPLLTSSNTQGACDMGLLAEYLPGYLEMPFASDRKLADYLDRVGAKSEDPTSFNEWKRENYEKLTVNFLQAMFAGAVSKSDDWGYDYLPKVDPGKDYTLGGMFDAMEAGDLKGLLVLGENPAVGPNGASRRKAMGKLDWLVVYDMFESETAKFWDSPQGKGSNTEVFMFPAPTVAEITGTVTNMSRWVQWQERALSPSAEDANRKEAIFLADELARGLKRAYSSGGKFPAPITSLSWWAEKQLEKPTIVMFEISGNRYRAGDEMAASETLRKTSELMIDGSTRCGCWLYLGASQKKLNNRQEYHTSDLTGIGLYPGFAWSWPNNIRIMYNRAGTGKDGKPYNSGQVLVAYGLDAWSCNDILDGPEDGPKKIRAFTATSIGVAKLFAEGMMDGPLPEFYEPIESGSSNSLEHAFQTSPLARMRKIDKIAQYGTDTAKKYGVIGLTYSLAEHHGTGQVTRYSRAIGEVVPAFFIEVGADLAKEKGIANGDKVKVSSARLAGGITGLAIVTPRLNAVQKGQYMVAVPENFGFLGEEPHGMPAHDLTLMSGDPNTGTAACRTFLCSIAKA